MRAWCAAGVAFCTALLMSRIAHTFELLAQSRRKALIPFITAGDPDAALTVPLMHALADAGADVIELGVPFSDPMADGPTIQRSSERALKQGTTLAHVLGWVAEFRKTNTRVPVVLMGCGVVSAHRHLMLRFSPASPRRRNSDPPVVTTALKEAFLGVGTADEAPLLSM